MKRFFYIPAALLLGLLAASLVNAAAAERCVAQWCGALETIELAAQSADWDDALAQLDDLRESWDARAAYFHIILQHDALNDAEALLARAKNAVLMRDEGALRDCLAELSARLHVLSETQEISLQNIL